MQAPAPTNHRITDDHQGRVEAPKAREQAFQLTIEEARAVPNVVTGLYSFIILSSYFLYAYIYVFVRYLLSEFIT